MMKIGIIGPCAAGKTTLIEGLKKYGIPAKHIAQEHSYVADMWRQLVKPDVLIYLDVSYMISLERRKMDWSEAEYEEQLNRLINARQNADLYLKTDEMTPNQVLEQVVDFLNREFAWDK
jgi:guanylate kinase